MGEEIKNLLEKEIKNQIENLASLEPGSEKTLYSSGKLGETLQGEAR